MCIPGPSDEPAATTNAEAESQTLEEGGSGQVSTKAAARGSNDASETTPPVDSLEGTDGEVTAAVIADASSVE